MDQVYIHFTDSKGALGIYNSKELWSSSFIEGVYAVAVGAPSVPEVQQTRLGRTTKLPNYCYPEECVWIAKKIRIKVVNILPTKNALKYLNGETPSIGSNFTQRLAIPTKEIPDPKNPPDWLFKENVKNLLNYLLID
ncbi:hypothetical protein EBU71_10015 [bacterium]|nr:hypothetical protein [Candidatus Elulimicrobium humile]